MTKTVILGLSLLFVAANLSLAAKSNSVTTSPAAATDSSKASTTKIEKATFAAGCFWGTEEYFRKLPGVTGTRVGYTGGAKKADYEEVGSGTTGHAESVEVMFDPKKISYTELLNDFFKMHDPTTLNRQGNDVGTQYRSAIFTHGPEQEKEAEAFKQKVIHSGAWGKAVTTEIKPAGEFFAAETYHQKYLEKNPGGYDNHYVRDLNFNK